MARRNILLTALTLILAAIVSMAEAQSDATEWLTAHNLARQAVGVGMPDLVWSDAAYNYAYSYAQSQANLCLPLTHSNGPYGENLAWNSDATKPVSWAVGAWVAEAPYYDYASNSCIGGECLHYTQVVWAATTSVGCYAVQCADGGAFYICSYDPPGNYVGQRPYTLP